MENRWDVPFSDDDRVKYSDFEMGFEACYQVKVTEFDTGGAEIVAANLQPLAWARKKASFGSGVLWPRTAEEQEKSKQKSKEASCRRATKKVRHHVRQLKSLYMFTLSQRENITDVEEFKRRFDLFRRRLSAAAKKHGARFEYLGVPEPQKRGAWHLHMACDSRILFRLMVRIWNAVNGPTEACPQGGGYVHLTSGKGRLRGHKKLAGYMSKYIGKTFESAEHFGAKRYWRSRSLPSPRVSTYLLPPGTQMEDVIKHVCTLGALLHADKKDWSTYLSEDAGVFWYSTD